MNQSDKSTSDANGPKSGEHSERKMVSLTPAMAAQIDDYRFANRIRTESEAIRELLDFGIQKARELGRLPEEPNQ